MQKHDATNFEEEVQGDTVSQEQEMFCDHFEHGTPANEEISDTTHTSQQLMIGVGVREKGGLNDDGSKLNGSHIEHREQTAEELGNLCLEQKPTQEIRNNSWSEFGIVGHITEREPIKLFSLADHSDEGQSISGQETEPERMLHVQSAPNAPFSSLLEMCTPISSGSEYEEPDTTPYSVGIHHYSSAEESSSVKSRSRVIAKSELVSSDSEEGTPVACTAMHLSSTQTESSDTHSSPSSSSKPEPGDLKSKLFKKRHRLVRLPSSGEGSKKETGSRVLTKNDVFTYGSSSEEDNYHKNTSIKGLSTCAIHPLQFVM